MAIIHTTCQLRGYLSKAGYDQLEGVLRQCATLYNAGLQEWRDAYSAHIGVTGIWSDRKQDWFYVERREKRAVPGHSTHYDQLKEFTGVRADDPFWNNLDVNLGRGVLQRLERAKNAFFRRVKAGETPGYPRFKSGRRWKTIEMAMVRPGMVRHGQVRIKGLPVIEIPSKRELPPSVDLKTLRITRSGRRVTVSLGYAVEREASSNNSACVGIDFGISDRMVLSTGEAMMAGDDIPAAGLESAAVPTSEASIFSIDGQLVAPDVGSHLGSHLIPRRTRRDRLAIVRKQQRLSRCRKGSRRWKQRAAVLANAWARRRVQNRNECHRITTEIVRQYGHIAVEALAIRDMSRSAAGTVEEPGRNVSAKSGLNREILDQTWGLIRQQLRYKAEWAGRRFVEVDPRHTSQTCNSCGVVDGRSRQGKVFQCVACGFTLDADLNAARNILRKSLAGGNSLLLAQ